MTKPCNAKPDTDTDITKLTANETTPGAADFPTEKRPALSPQCDRPFLTVAELQQRIPVSRRTIFAWRKQGWLPSVQAGTKILFHWPSVENALLRQQRGGGE